MSVGFLFPATEPQTSKTFSNKIMDLTQLSENWLAFLGHLEVFTI